MKRALVIVAVALIVGVGLFAGLRGCTLMPWNKAASGSSTVTVSVTSDYGQVKMKTRKVTPATGDSALDLIKRVAAVDTEYGGGFVSSIDGVGSSDAGGKRKDWFYYVNGILSGEGSGQFGARGGDVIWWDYHDWSGGSYVASVVGAYPHPFTRGYSPVTPKTTVAYGSGMEELAREVGGYLDSKGAEVARYAEAGSFNADGKGPSIVFLTRDEALRTPWVVAMLGAQTRAGAAVALRGNDIVTLDVSGAVSRIAGGEKALILAAGKGMGDAAPVWLVICDGEAGAARARHMLVKDPSSLALKVAAAADPSGKVYALPRRVP
jgi:hypothetical protein